MKSLLSILLLFLSVAPAGATVFLDRLLATGAIDSAQASLMVVDLETGSIVDALNADLSLIPASIMKAATVAALLPESGCGYRYATRVMADGKISDGVLNGNLLIVGSGDPSINAGCDPPGPDFVSEVVNALTSKGIESITGEIAVDSSVFPGPATPPSWAAADTRQKYGTGCHGFNFRHNAAGSAAVADPSAVFRASLASAIAKAGISLGKNTVKATSKPTLLFTHQSAAIDEIMRSCMMRSDNLFAEALLRTYPLLAGKPADTDTATRLASDHWKKLGLDLKGVKLVDGSGLSRDNRVTASFMADILARMATDPDYASFFPLAGQEGTLKSFLKDTPLDSYVALKTGSMSGIQCYAGYKLDDDFVPTHAIVVILNKLPKGRPAARAAIETYLLSLFAEPAN